MQEGLTEALQLPPNGTNEETAQAIVAALTQAKDDSNTQSRLQTIYHAISQHGIASLLDPLETVPLLLSETSQAAHDIIALVGECGNAKEVIIAAQEAVERISSIASSSDTPEDDDDDDDDDDLPSQLIRLIDLYSSAIPRLKIIRKPPSQIIQPSLSDLELTFQHVGGHATQTECREIISHVSHLVRRIVSWVKSIASVETQEISRCIEILRRLLDHSLTACAHSINSSVAQRTFQECFPRLTIRATVSAGWEDGEKTATVAVDAYKSLGFTSNDALLQPSIGSLIYLAHSSEPSPSAQHLLSALLTTLLTAMQTNTALDESVSILLKTTFASNNEIPKPELSAQVVLPLFTVLPFLATSHPDPDVRLQVFRIMSLTLSLAPSPIRLQVLFDLASETDLPQMSGAALVFVKEAVLNALSRDLPNVFASRLLLQTFGPVIFLPRPSDFFSSPHKIKDLQESRELLRLVECLSLYYVLLVRDERNRTGVRDPETIRNVEKSLLAPLRSSLVEWLQTTKQENFDSQVIVSIASLQVGLERVESVLERLSPEAK